MMILIFLGTIVLGLCFFAFVFSKELKSGALDEAPGEGGGRFKDVGPQAPMPAGSSLPTLVLPVEKAVKIPDAVPGGILGERCVKLEQLLEEKNRSLEKLEKELASERSHRGEFESFKEILQRQSEDLRAQNKKLKEDLARVVSLQAGLVSVKAPAAPGASGKFDEFFDGRKAEVSAVSLHDVFNDNKNKNG